MSIYAIDITRERGSSVDLITKLREGLNQLSPSHVIWICRPNQSALLPPESTQVLEGWEDDISVINAAVDAIRAASASANELRYFASYSGTVWREVQRRLAADSIHCETLHLGQLFPGMQSHACCPAPGMQGNTVPDYALTAALCTLLSGEHLSESSALPVTALRPKMVFHDARCQKRAGEPPQFISHVTRALMDAGLIRSVADNNTVGYYLTDRGAKEAQAKREPGNMMPTSSTLAARSAPAGRPTSLKEKALQLKEILEELGLTCPPIYRDAFMGALDNAFQSATNRKELLAAEDLITMAAEMVPLDAFGELTEVQRRGYLRGMRGLLRASGVLLDEDGKPIVAVQVFDSTLVAGLKSQAADWVIAMVLFEIIGKLGSVDPGYQDAELWALFGSANQTPGERRENRKALSRAHDLLAKEGLIIFDALGNTRVADAADFRRYVQ